MSIFKSLSVRFRQSYTLRSFNYWLDSIVNSQWYDFPFGKNIRATKDIYLNLWESECNKNYQEIDNYESISGGAINTKWLENLALHTQVVIKKSPLCWQHGRVLYSTLSKWLNENSKNEFPIITIFETGTARGFSSLCMAKALSDAERNAKIITFDVLPHSHKIYWNCIDDIEGAKSREELLKPWHELVAQFIIYQQGDSKLSLKKIAVSRIHFAFLDGSHKFKDVMNEFLQVGPYQKKGDVIVYDDYTQNQFPGLVRAVDKICNDFNYKKDIIYAHDGRGYAITRKN